MDRRAIQVATIVLFGIGVGSALLILYNYLENPHIISRSQAVSAALKFNGISQSEAANATMVATLDQVKGNGVAMIIDENTFRPTCCADYVPFGYPDEYLWKITVTVKSDRIHGVIYHYNIDATTGKLVESDHETATFPG